MKTVLISALLFLVLTGYASGCCGNPYLEADELGTLNVICYKYIGGPPAEGIGVTLTGAGQTWQKTTDENGSCTFLLYPGVYTVFVGQYSQQVNFTQDNMTVQMVVGMKISAEDYLLVAGVSLGSTVIVIGLLYYISRDKK